MIDYNLAIEHVVEKKKTQLLAYLEKIRPYGQKETTREELRAEFDRMKDDPELLAAFRDEAKRRGYSEESVTAHLRREAIMAMRRAERSE